MDNILSLHNDLKQGVYTHSGYHAFKINDPKPRDIHKASVRDRLLHHALYRGLYSIYDKRFIHDSYSCRLNKGTHKAMLRFQKFLRSVSKNHTRTCWVLKCDIKKFFASIDHATLKGILARDIADTQILSVLENVIDSFSNTQGVGLPLGNLTSQLLVNVYMNEFDQYAKHILKGKHYIRYADDFVFMSPDRDELLSILPQVREYLSSVLKLELHPHKVSIGTIASGVDFLGWVHFPTHRILRSATKKRMLRNLKVSRDEKRLQSYRGLLTHGNTHKLYTAHLQP